MKTVVIGLAKSALHLHLGGALRVHEIHERCDDFLAWLRKDVTFASSRELCVQGVILIVEVLKLQKSNSRKLLGLPWEEFLDIGLYRVAQEEEPVLISDPLEVLELSVRSILEALEELAVEVLQEAHK